MILTAMAHTAGHLAPNHDAALEGVVNVMKGYHLSLGLGMNPSLYDAFDTLSWSMAITFLAIGTLTLLITGSADASDRLVRRVGWVNAIWVGTTVFLTYYEQIPPPLIMSSMTEVVLLLALALPGKSSATS